MRIVANPRRRGGTSTAKRRAKGEKNPLRSLGEKLAYHGGLMDREVIRAEYNPLLY